MGLTRQNSGGSSASGFSAASGLSGATRASRVFKEADHEGGSEGHDNQNKALTGALFGVLFTLSKEKNDSKKMAIATIMVDFFLLFILLVTPDYPWAINRDAWIWKLLWYAEFHNPIAWQGWNFYLVIFYLLSGMLFLSVGMCIWVAWCFKNDSFPFLWPIKVLRMVVAVFFGLTYIASLNVFIIMLSCHKVNNHWIHSVYMTECLAFPHVVHLMMGVISSVVFAGVAYLMAVSEHDLEPLAKGLLAMPHSMCELRALILKTVVSATRIILRDQPKLQGIIFVVCFAMMFWYHIKLLPHYVAWVNCLRCALWAVLAWVSFLLCALIFVTNGKVEEHPMALKSNAFHTYHMGHQTTSGNTTTTTAATTATSSASAIHRRLLSSSEPEHEHIFDATWSKQVAITKALWFGFIPIFLLGGALAYVRLYFMWKIAIKFRDQWTEGMRYKDVHRFYDSYDVEIVSRVMRVWMEDEETLDPDALDLADTIFKAGLSVLPQSPFVHIAYANFLIEARGNHAGGWSHLEQARKMSPNLSFKFSIFTREQEHKQKAATTSTGEAAVDLVSYVEFQRSHRMLMSYHKAALLASKEFWQMLLRSDISLMALTKACHNIEIMESKATKTFQGVLERYPRSAKLLRSYAQFMEQVKNDPWTAAKYYSEAEKQEELKDEADDGGAEVAGLGKINEKVDAIITINSAGVIQMANKIACKLFGYKMGELERKNVSILMPPPFSQRHNSYMHNYVTTGKSKILNTQREVVALHKDRFVFPTHLTVTKASGTGQDSVFMGVVRPIELDGSSLKAYLMSTGVILCCDQSFTDCLGWSPTDLTGKVVTSFAEDPGQITRLMERANIMSEEEMAAGKCHEDVVMLHKYADPVPLQMGVTMGGSDGQRLLVVTFKRMGPPPLAFTIDHKGRVLYATSSLCTLLGYQLKQILQKNLTEMLPAPFAQLHHHWIKEAEQAEGRSKLANAPCKIGSTVLLLASNGTQVPVKLSMKELISDGDADTVSWFIQVTKCARENVHTSRRLSLRVNCTGKVLGVAPCPTQLFGFDQNIMEGQNLDQIIDTFQMWSEQGEELGVAVEAMLSLSANQHDLSWRVGVLSQGPPPQAATGMSARALKKAMSIARPRAAIMQLEVDLDDADEDGNIMMTLHLWKAEALTGTIDVAANGSIAKADPVAALLLGLSITSLQHHHISRFVKVPTDCTIENLMTGNQQAKRGGISKPHLNTTGPKRIVDAWHADGRPMLMSLQTVLKDANSRNRAQIVVKVASTSRGTVDAIKRALAGEEDSTQVNQTEPAAPMITPGPHDDGLGAQLALPSRATAVEVTKEQEQGSSSSRPLTPSKFGFKLPMEKVTQVQQQRAGTPRRSGSITHRSEQPATARFIDLDIAFTPREGDEDQERNPGWPLVDNAELRVSARRRSGTPVPAPDAAAMMDAQLPGAVNATPGVGPEEEAHLPPPTSPVPSHHYSDGDLRHMHTRLTDGSPMSVSAESYGQNGQKTQQPESQASSSEDEEAEAEAEDEEQDPEVRERKKSVKKVKEWLSSDYTEVINAIKGDLPPASVVAGLKNKHGSFKVRRSGTPEEEEAVRHKKRGLVFKEETSKAVGFPAELEAGGNNSVGGGEEVHAKFGGDNQSDRESSCGSEATTDTNTTDYKRGKRLKRLVKILCGKKAQEPLMILRLHTWCLIGMLLVVHLGAFILILNMIKSQETIVSSAYAAGEANVVSHRLLLLAVNTEAAFRSYGFNYSACKTFSKEILTLTNRLEYLHRGLYLGFKALKQPSDPGFWTLWHQKILTAAVFRDTDPPSLDQTNVSMWEAGNLYISALREVSYLAANQPPGFNMANNRFWMYVHENGPSILDHGYDSSMDILIQQVRTTIFSFQRILLALLVVEGAVLSMAVMLYMLMLLRRAAIQRVATFAVFLFIPTGFVKQMANKKLKLGDDSDSESGSEKNAKHQKAVTTDGEAQHNEAPPKASTARGSVDFSMGAPSLTTKPANRKVSITVDAADGIKQFGLKENANWDAQSAVSRTKSEASLFTGLVKRSRSVVRKMGFGGGPLVLNGKRFKNIWGDMFKVLWPFVAWSVAVISIYIASYSRAMAMTHFIVDMDLSLASNALVPRVHLKMSEAVLNRDPAYQYAAQQELVEDALDLADAYHHALYGGRFGLHVFQKDGQKKIIDVTTSGKLFYSKQNSAIYFRTRNCLASSSTCVNSTSPYYAVTHNALDMMMMRFIEEALLLSEDSQWDLIPYNNSRYLYAQSVGGHDLREGASTAARLAYTDSQLTPSYLRSVTVVLFLISLFLWVIFSFVTFKPFLLNSTKVGTRVAELLSQLPPDMDVEGMVQSAWSHVMQSHLRDDDDEDAAAANNASIVRRSVDLRKRKVMPLDGHNRQSSMEASFRIGANREDGEESESQAVAEGVAWPHGIEMADLRKRRAFGGLEGENAV